MCTHVHTHMHTHTKNQWKEGSQPHLSWRKWNWRRDVPFISKIIRKGLYCCPQRGENLPQIAGNKHCSQLHTQIPLGESWSPRSTDSPVRTVWLLLKFLAQEGPIHSHQDTGTEEQPGAGTLWFQSASWSWPCATALYTQIPPGKNWSLKSTDTQACRRTSCSQRQKDQLIPEINRWQEARART